MPSENGTKDYRFGPQLEEKALEEVENTEVEELPQPCASIRQEEPGELSLGWRGMSQERGPGELDRKPPQKQGISMRTGSWSAGMPAPCCGASCMTHMCLGFLICKWR